MTSRFQLLCGLLVGLPSCSGTVDETTQEPAQAVAAAGTITWDPRRSTSMP